MRPCRIWAPKSICGILSRIGRVKFITAALGRICILLAEFIAGWELMNCLHVWFRLLPEVYWSLLAIGLVGLLAARRKLVCFTAVYWQSVFP